MATTAARIVVCPNCGAKNRVDDQRAVTQQPVCGRCRAKLALGDDSTPGHPIDVSDATWSRDVLAASEVRPVLVDCWAPWCGPCRMIAPTINEIAAESQGRYTVAKLNTDENQRTAAALSIDGIPTLLIFRNRQIVDRLVGLQPKPVIAARLAQASA